MLLMGVTATGQRMMLLTLVLGRFLMPASARNHRTLSFPLSVLNKAMLGVDPLRSNPLGNRDTGMKDQIFLSTYPRVETPHIIQVNAFIGRAVQDVRCSRLSFSSMQTASNMNLCRAMTSESVSFKTRASISERREGFGGGASVGAASGSNAEDQKCIEFFKKTGGEIVRGSAEC
ncbi:hypothetical protein FHG87_014915 [Trinorchestia longiramus]|nr:hypothetical protein FHG87_014915 [Trinorchestia longiramus]